MIYMSWIHAFELLCYILTAILLWDMVSRKDIGELKLFLSGAISGFALELLAVRVTDIYHYNPDFWLNIGRRPFQFPVFGGLMWGGLTVCSLRLARRLGFTVMRTKMPVINDLLEPVLNWREIIEGALPLAEELGIRMCPEIHTPSNLKGKLVTDFVDFIKETGTKNFGLNIDFSVFRTGFSEGEWRDPNYTPNVPEDIIPLLPYIYCCHAKFINMSDDFEETTIPYPEIVKVMQENGYDGYLLSEYEGADKYEDGYEVGQTLRKQHIMLKNLLGD